MLKYRHDFLLIYVFHTFLLKATVMDMETCLKSKQRLVYEFSINPLIEMNNDEKSWITTWVNPGNKEKSNKHLICQYTSKYITFYLCK